MILVYGIPDVINLPPKAIQALKEDGPSLCSHPSLRTTGRSGIESMEGQQTA